MTFFLLTNKIFIYDIERLLEKKKLHFSVVKTYIWNERNSHDTNEQNNKEN